MRKPSSTDCCRRLWAEMAERKRSRRRLIALAIVVVLFAIAALVLRDFTQPEKLTAFLIDKAKSELGAELTLGTTGKFAFTPKLNLVLAKPNLKELQGGRVFLSADSAEVVVPWSTLWSDRYDIERIDLVKPQLDLDALSAWIAAQPPSPNPPDIRFALHAKDATIVSGGKTVASGVALDLASAGDLIAWSRKWRESSLTPPLDGTIEAETLDVGGARLEGVRIESRENAPGKPTP